VSNLYNKLLYPVNITSDRAYFKRFSV